MPITLKEICHKPDLLAPGHRACSGCGETIIVRQVLQAINALGHPVVAASPTGCLEIISSPFPYTSWRVPWIHSAFENVASTIAGAETMYRSLVKQGKIADRTIKFVAFAGDGATYDIGFQWLSGVLERGNRILYVCLNNEAYMNTGIQRSSATPLGTWTTTTPAGKVIPGKREHRKDLTAIVTTHDIPYVAQAAPHAWRDLMTKVQKAINADGPAFINVISPCQRGWRYDPSQTIALSKLAVETGVWALYEVDHGVWKTNYKPAPRKPLIEWLKSQGRFSHLLLPENQPVVEALQQRTDQEWAKLEENCKKAAG